MTKPTTEQYSIIANKLLAKGVTADQAYELLAKSNFVVSLESVKYTVYASRVIAIMHELSEQPEALEL